MHEIARPHPIHRVLDRLKWPLAILALLVVPALILQDRATSPVRLASLEHQVGEVLRELRRASHELRQPSDWNPDIAAG
jgi:hypothetical protein